MPLYPYRCTQCGHRFEKIQKFDAEPEKVCPKCGGALERPLTAPGLQFKGAGWYVNDYAPKSASSSAESAPADKKPAQTKAAASSDAASAAAPSAPPSAPAPSSSSSE